MPSPWPRTPPTAQQTSAYADAINRSFWLDTLPARDPHAPLDGVLDADLCIVGGGYTGLWAALYAKALDPARDVVLLEATRCGAGASGRNGGFLQSSLTHGIGNGLSRFPDEVEQLERMGLENFHALAADLEATRGRRRVRGRRRPDRCARAARARRPAGGGRARAELRPRRRTARRRAGPGRGELADVPRRLVDQDRLRARPPGQARRRPAGGGGPRRRARSASTARSATSARRRPPYRSPPMAGSSTPAESCSRRAPTRRSCARSAATSRPCTTTCS